MEKNKVLPNITSEEVADLELKNSEKAKVTNISINGKPVPLDAKVRVDYTTRRVVRSKVDDEGKAAATVYAEGPGFFDAKLEAVASKAVQNAWTKPNPADVPKLINDEGLYDNSDYFVVSSEGKKTGGGWSTDLCEALAKRLNEAYPDKNFTAEYLEENSRNGRGDTSAKEYRAKFNKKEAPYNKFYRQAQTDLANAAVGSGDDV